MPLHTPPLTTARHFDLGYFLRNAQPGDTHTESTPSTVTTYVFLARQDGEYMGDPQKGGQVRMVSTSRSGDDFVTMSNVAPCYLTLMGKCTSVRMPPAMEPPRQVTRVEQTRVGLGDVNRRHREVLARLGLSEAY